MVTFISDCEKIQKWGKIMTIIKTKKKKGVEFIYVSERSLWKRGRGLIISVIFNSIGPLSWQGLTYLV